MNCTTIARWHSLPLGVAVLVALLVSMPTAHADGGLLDALDDGFNPAEDRRGGDPDTSWPRDEPTRAALPLPRRPGVLTADPQGAREALRELEGRRWEDVAPVDDLTEARERLAGLDARRRRLEGVFDDEARASADLLARQADAMRVAWQPLIDALGDGQSRSREAWAEIAREVRRRAMPMPHPPHVGGVHDDLAHRLGLADEAEASPPPPPLRTPTLGDLVEAFEGHDKPRGMHPNTWIALQEAFEADLEAVRLAAGHLRGDLARRRADALASLDETIGLAKASLAGIEAHGETPPEWMRRQMAWRLHQADVAERRRLLADLEALAKQREGEMAPRGVALHVNPLDLPRSLESIADYIEAGGATQAPEPDAFVDLDQQGLPSLYPREAVIDDGKVHYERLIESNIARYDAALADLRHQLAAVEERVIEEDRHRLREEAGDRRFQDWMAGREELRALRDRRAWVGQRRQELAASRPERVAEARTAIEAEMAKVRERLAAEYARRDALTR